MSASADSRTRPATRGWRDFQWLWGGQSVSLLGDQILLLALPLAATQALGASAFQVGVLAAAVTLPYLLIGLPAGVWVARFGLRRSMVCADAVRGLAVLSVPLAGFAGVLTYAQLLVVALVTGVCSVFFQIAYQSFAPLLIADSDGLHSANTKLTFSESMALLLGPGLAGFLVGLTGAVRAMLADATSFLVSMSTLLMIRHHDAPVPVADRQPVLREVADGIRFVLRQPLLRLIMASGLVYNLGIAMYMAMITIFAVQYLHLPPAVLGLATGLGGAGFPVGTLLARWLTRRFGIGPTLGIASFPIVAGLVIVVSSFDRYAAVMISVGTFLYGMGSGAFKTNALTIRHIVTPDDMSTRATAVHRFVTWGVMPVGAVVAGLIGDHFGLRAAMVTAVLVTSLCLIPSLSTPMRRAKRLTRPETALPTGR
ncbi:MFS transporter [Actinoplanes siamensis]|uniref:MFS transporter n=1 Tax=Actinoplanes siamensis TaxID=1223317 RepID=A0A919N0Q0_9ACTN|nr:MFS transporter [Actinoplanes siamensis]GIF03134.1 MFS transporter [Actinoplanes siamensis]